MNKGKQLFTTRVEGSSITVLFSKDEETVLSLRTKGWETRFFNRIFGALTINPRLHNYEGTQVLHSALDSLLFRADNEYDLIEVHCPMSGMQLIPILEDKGFRLVDSRITFLTVVDKKDLKDCSPEIGSLFRATEDDLEDILLLTHESLTYNPLFFSRFKNSHYFSLEETKRYYSAWIENHLHDPNSLFAVTKKDNRIVGFYIYKRAGLYDGKNIYKGLLGAVAPDYRGHRLHAIMQLFLQSHFPEEHFYLDNTTQLTNFSTIKSHIRSQKQLNRIELTFYRKNPSR